MLRMRENSLFAILLRGSWVYSALIAVALIIAVHVFTKGHYTYFGVAMAIPFLVISGIAGYKQMSGPGTRLLEETDEWVRAARARELTTALTDAYREQGYKVEPFKGKAAELRLESEGRLRLLCCKRVKAATSGAEPLQSLVAAGEHHEAAGLIFVALGELSTDARNVAVEGGVEILGLEDLAPLLKKRVRGK